MDDNYLELKVNFGRLELEFPKPLKKIDFDELSETISYYPVCFELNDITVGKNPQCKNISYLNGYYYDIDYIYKYNQGLFDTFDMISGDTNQIYEILFDEAEQIKTEYQTFSNNIFYLDRIYVEKKYRNKGYAKLLLNQLEDLIKYVAKLNVGIIIVCAQPFEKNGDEEKIIRDDPELKNKLIELYKKSGFKDTGSSYDYLVKVVEY